MLTRIDLRGAGDVRSLLPRPHDRDVAPVAAVREILTEVRKRGDAAVREYSERFDEVKVDILRVEAIELSDALDAIPPALRDALELAHGNIRAFHQAQMHDDARHTDGGLVVREMRRAVDRAGIYIPGGRAPLLSTVLMTAVPARVAGVPEVVLCSPPDRETGTVATGILAAAALAGVDEVYRIGGAQGIAAMAYGTESVPAVDVIVGPGNVWVATAKREVASEGAVGVPSAFTGPSEVVVVADDSTPAELAAIDLMVQAEHGPDGLAWLITWSDEVADAVATEVARRVAVSPRRAELESTLTANGYAVVVDDPADAIAVANLIAPEHLQLMNADPLALVPLVRSAGAVFCGCYSPASVGDYVAGPSHVLPTFGSARFASALRVDDFLKQLHVVTVDEAALSRLAPYVAALAEAEGLVHHAESVRLRDARRERAET
jgi:histidinol dehydrogenase